jgi:CDP-glucose 4,6-dehydratase
MEMNTEFWEGKKVFLTGHTGFKGGWLTLWLKSLGAEIHGYALSPPTEPNLFNVANIARELASSTIGDIRDLDNLVESVQNAQPDIVIHMAAQPLVRYSYNEPVETYAVNVMGTVNILEAVKRTSGIRAVINVTTDKCYENREWIWPYRENEAIGGYDPYSSSKACSELVTAAYRRSYMTESGINLATARAGNVVGGGDWATDRLLPDLFNSVDTGNTLVIRSPDAIRPWQHVLEPLSGYLVLAEKLYNTGETFADAWNFGPGDDSCQSVRSVIEKISIMLPELHWDLDAEEQLHEAGILKLDSSKAKNLLGWNAQWSLDKALQKTVEWYQGWKAGEDMREKTIKQIQDFEATAG